MMTILFYLTSFLFQLSGSKSPYCLTVTQLKCFFPPPCRYLSQVHVVTSLSIKDEMLTDKHNDMVYVCQRKTKCSAENSGLSDATCIKGGIRFC